MVVTPYNLLVAMIVVLGLNQALIRFSLYARVPFLYWLIQALDVVIVGFVFVHGIPGLVGSGKLINWIIGLVVSLHFVQNYQAKLAAASDERREEIEREWEELQARREEIQRQEAEAAKSKGREPDPPAQG